MFDVWLDAQNALMACEKQQQRKHIKAYWFRILSQYLEEGIVTLCIAFLLAIVVKIFSRLGFLSKEILTLFVNNYIFIWIHFFIQGP